MRWPKIILCPQGGAEKSLGGERHPAGHGGASFIHSAQYSEGLQETAKQGD